MRHPLTTSVIVISVNCLTGRRNRCTDPRFSEQRTGFTEQRASVPFDGKSRGFTKTSMPSFDPSIVGRISIVCRAGARIRETRNGEVVSLCSKNDRQFN